ncbi:MAG: OmpH family outer membrane protein [Bryobacteraceae bacterium]
MSLRMGFGPLMVCSALLGVAQIASAQPKVAVINLQRAVLESAEIKKADADMQARYKPRTAAIEQLQKEIADIAQRLQVNAGKFTQQAEAELTAQGQKKQRDLQRLQEDLQADVDRDRNDVLQKATAKMNDIVKKIAEEKGYDLVVEASATIYFKSAMEITSDAIGAYDKAYPVAPVKPAK